MTTLRGFQSEIEEIHAQELARHRTQGVRVLSSHDGQRREARATSVSVVEGITKLCERSDLRSSEQEERILGLLVAHHDEQARNALASLLTQFQGEYVFRIGHRPPLDPLFKGEQLDSVPGWTGISRTQEEVDELSAELSRAQDDIGGKASILYRAGGLHPRSALLLRLPPSSVAMTPEVRCAVVGNVDSGKSTTLGVLTRGALDDGRGRARVTLFRHKHEIETGRTSSVGMEILGFSASGVPILPGASGPHDYEGARRDKLGWDEISARSAKIVSFSDLAGHERYLKTTLYGLTSGAPSCVMLMIGGNAGLIGMAKEHLAITLALNVPVVVCITKVDMTPTNILAETTRQVVKILKSPGCRKVPVFVDSIEVAVELASTFAQCRLCPIFRISNVTGDGLDYLRTFLNLLPPSDTNREIFAIDQPLEYSVTEVWSVPYVGTVVNGILNSGTVKTGDSILFGPDSNGNFQQTVVRSMQRKRVDIASAEAGQCVALALKRVKRAAIRKGMVIVHKSDSPPKATLRFEGQVLVLYHNTTMQRNYQAMLHCGAVRQTVRIISMDHPQGVLRTGDRATVQFEFISHPEFIKAGMKLLFREGKTKVSKGPDRKGRTKVLLNRLTQGLGVITRLL